MFGADRNEYSCGIVSRIDCSLPREESEAAGTRPGVHALEKERVHMTAFLVFFGLAALLVVGGVRGSLHLRPHRLSTGRRVSGLRRSYATPMHDTTGEETSHYYRKAWHLAPCHAQCARHLHPQHPQCRSHTLTTFTFTLARPRFITQDRAILMGVLRHPVQAIACQPGGGRSAGRAPGAGRWGRFPSPGRIGTVSRPSWRATGCLVSVARSRAADQEIVGSCSSVVSHFLSQPTICHTTGQSGSWRTNTVMPGLPARSQ
jgi:hypothetical protein